jgi:hypothetical protein
MELAMSCRSDLPGVPMFTAPPVNNLDAELLKLLDECSAADKEADRLGKLFSDHEKKAFAHRENVPIPDALRVRPEDGSLGLVQEYDALAHGGMMEREKRDTYDRNDTLRWTSDKWLYIERVEHGPDDWSFHVARRAPSPAARARADEIIQAVAEWEKERCRTPHGYRRAEREWEVAIQRRDRLRGRVLALRPRTLAGIVGKARLVEEMISSGELDTPGEAEAMKRFLADIVAFNVAPK